MVGKEIGKRPCELLGVRESTLEDLLLDAAILSQSSEAEEDNSLAADIERKRRNMWLRQQEK